jgi:hypothetical protein
VGAHEIWWREGALASHQAARETRRRGGLREVGSRVKLGVEPGMDEKGLDPPSLHNNVPGSPFPLILALAAFLTRGTSGT